MQIIIGQAEIEQAITQHVLSMVAIHPGQSIDIELKATRGESGYQAFISIGEKSNQPSPVVKTVPLVQSAQQTPRTPAEIRQVMAAEAAAEEAAAAAEEVAIPDNEGEPTIQTANEVAEEEAQNPQQEATEQPVAVSRPRLARVTQPAATEAPAEQVGGSNTPPPRKLFGGFSKPKN
jgi:hypothetical protein